jgi:hypothetical protein
METRKLLLGVVAGSAVLAAASSAMAMTTFAGEVNKLSGVPVAGDEMYTNGPGATYLTPANVFGAPVLPGSVVGKIESIRPGGLGVGGINLPQSANVAGVATDNRNAIVNPDVVGTPYAGTPFWGARSMGVVQWQAIQDGISTSLAPLGSITGIVSGLTPRFITAKSAGALADDGLAPGSHAGDGIPDFIPWVSDGAGGLTAQYIIQYWDIQSALGAGISLSNAVKLSGKVTDYEDTRTTLGGQTLLDISQPGAAYGPTSPSDQDLDGKKLVQTGLDPATGLAIGPPSEVSDATDGPSPLLLAGYLRDVSATLIFRLAPGDTVPTLELKLSANEVDYFDGSLLGALVLGATPPGEASLFPNGYSTGTLGADLINVDWANTTGQDPSGFLSGMPFDFAGYGSASANQSFDVSGVVPEPVTAGMAGLGIGALGLFLSRRRRIA